MQNNSSGSVEPPYVPPIQREITFLSDDRVTILHHLSFDDNEHVTQISFIPLKQVDSKIYIFKGWDMNEDDIPDAINLYMTQNNTLVAVFEGVSRVDSDVTYNGEVYLTGCPDEESLEEVTLPNYIGTSKVIGVRGHLFSLNNQTIKKIIIPEGITNFNNSAFRNLKALEEVVFPPEVDVIGSSIFQDCPLLSKVTMPLKCTTVGGYAFSGCASLKAIDITCCNMINSRMFDGCASLEKIDGLDNIKTVAPSFGDNSGIKTLKFTQKNISIFDNAFNGMKELTTLEILGEVFYLGYNNFLECNKFKNHICKIY